MTAVELMIDVIGRYNEQASIWNCIKRDFDTLTAPIEPLLAVGLVDADSKASWLDTATRLIDLGRALMSLQDHIMSMTNCKWPNGETVSLNINLSDEEIMAIACFPTIVAAKKESIWLQ